MAGLDLNPVLIFVLINTFFLGVIATTALVTILFSRRYFIKRDLLIGGEHSSVTTYLGLGSFLALAVAVSFSLVTPTGALIIQIQSPSSFIFPYFMTSYMLLFLLRVIGVWHRKRFERHEIAEAEMEGLMHRLSAIIDTLIAGLLLVVSVLVVKLVYSPFYPDVASEFNLVVTNLSSFSISFPNLLVSLFMIIGIPFVLRYIGDRAADFLGEIKA